MVLLYKHTHTLHVNTHTHTHTHSELQSADGSLNAVLESPKVEGNRRRPRWKWSPISTQILTEAFKKVDSLGTSHSQALFSIKRELGNNTRTIFVIHVLVLMCTSNIFCGRHLGLTKGSLQISYLPTVALLDPTLPYLTLPWLYLILPYPTSLYHGSTWSHLTLPHSTMALLDPTLPYPTLPWLYLILPYPTPPYLTLPWLYLILPAYRTSFPRESSV